MAFKDMNHIAGFSIPHPRRAIRRGSDDTPHIVAERCVQHGITVSNENLKRRPGLGIPQPCGLVVGGRHDPLAIEAESGVLDGMIRRCEDVQSLTGVRIPGPLQSPRTR